MVNDRVYIVCECGEMQLLLKWYPSGGSHVADDDRVKSFMDEHIVLCGDIPHTIKHLPLKLVTESSMPKDYS